MEFKPVINSDLTFKLASKVLPKEGNLVYEYNPFRNYRLNQDMYEYEGQYYTLQDLKDIKKVTTDGTFWYENGNKIENKTKDVPQLREAGELVDFITNELSFDINHPVNILPQYSYDNSVNLILNDGKNKPKLINSRFSAQGRNKYQIVDRKGNYDTNIYDQGEQFDTDTSLYKQITKLPRLQFLGTTCGGNMSVGNYHFYFRYVDADGNQSDFIAESGLVSIFIGGTPGAIRGGFRKENSNKLVRFLLSNIDKSYQKVEIYYTRNTSDIYQNNTVEAIRINQHFNVNSSGVCDIVITGLEPTTTVTIDEINPFYQVCDNAYAQVECQNRLFLANVQKPELNYEDLENVSLFFLPFLEEKPYEGSVDKNYNVNAIKSKGYYDSEYIYNFTGYWDQEIYRIGIVYILGNNTLSPVFNIRGASEIGTYKENFYSTNGDFAKENHTVNKDEDHFIYSDTKTAPLENARGVISFKASENPTQERVFGIDIRVHKDVIDYLQREYRIKGFFFVRQKRIPTTLCQALTIATDKKSHTPVLPIENGKDSMILNQYQDNFSKKYICLNTKTGEIVDGMTQVKIPKGWLATVGMAVLGASIIVGGVLTGGALVAAAAAANAVAATGIGAVGWIGVGVGTALGGAGVIGTVVNALKPGHQYAHIYYKDKKDWEVYAVQSSENLKGDKCYVAERFLTDGLQLEHDFINRLYFLDESKVSTNAAICPEYDVNSPYLNSLFNTEEFTVDEYNLQPETEYLKYDVYDERHFYNSKLVPSSGTSYKCRILGVEDNVKLVAIGDTMFSARAGEAEEAFRYEYIEDEQKTSTAFNLLRGSYGPYIAISGYDKPNRILNIRIPGYSPNQMKDYFKIRFEDKSSFYAISDRIDLDNIDIWLKKSGDDDFSTVDKPVLLELRNKLYRGDCYICQFTHRVNRNFQDPSSPTNDDIVDSKCWAKNYRVEDDVVKKENFDKINLGDVNAIQLGMWVTSQYRSSINLNIRNIDDSIPDEKSLFGTARTFYPYDPISADGCHKIPEALCYNKGYEQSVSSRYNFEVPDVPYIKNRFVTRIMYSDISVNESFKNGFRVFQGTHFRDYPITYGSITKLIESQGNIICVFEHGIALIPVNERTVSGEGSGGNVYINTNNVLPNNPNILSGTFGSQWPDSICKTNSGNIYGVDTVAKKIWMITPQGQFKTISDFQVQEFLNNNISLTERETTPIIGIRNVKTHYNAFKQDVMFTFYDNTYGFEEKAWNLCWNEYIQKFITFYSWLPSFSENIHNTYFSFDRNTSKWIAKLGICDKDSNFAEGVVLDDNTIKPNDRVIGNLDISKSLIPVEKNSGLKYFCTFTLEHDPLGNYKNFEIVPMIGNSDYTGDDIEKITEWQLRIKNGVTYQSLCTEQYVRQPSKEKIDYTPTNPKYYIYPNTKDKKVEGENEILNYELGLPLAYDETLRRIWIDQSTYDKKTWKVGDKVVHLLNIRVNITFKRKDEYTNIKEMEEFETSYNDSYSTYNAGFCDYVVAVIPEYNKQFLSTDFWKHGQSGIIDLKDTIKPTHWYGKQHPFEFEFIVNDNPALHKVFDNLQIISNKAEPESFHYEIVGESYDFSKDKKNMYIRQEATRRLYQENGFDIVYDHDYTNLLESHRPLIKKPDGTILAFDKSTLFPVDYYVRQDTYNEIEDYYHAKDGTELGKDFSALAGGEIVRYENLNEYRIWNHAKAVNIDRKWDGSKWIEGSRLRGNMHYKEDSWYVQVNPLNLVQKNEDAWNKDKIPIEISQSPIPDEAFDIEDNKPLTIPEKERDIVSWGNLEIVNKEVKLKDKWIKIRVRYSGKDVAVISAIKTLYSISYA